MSMALGKALKTLEFIRSYYSAGLEIKKNVWLQFANTNENLVTTLKILVAKLIKAIQLRNK